MKRISLSFGTNAEIKRSPVGTGDGTHGDADFSSAPMGANPPTA